MKKEYDQAVLKPDVAAPPPVDSKSGTNSASKKSTQTNIPSILYVSCICAQSCFVKLTDLSLSLGQLDLLIHFLCIILLNQNLLQRCIRHLPKI